jgi:hypothetical protein
MKADDKDKELEGLIRSALGRDRLRFDFPRWKQAHRKSIEAFQSPTQPPSVRSAHSFSRYLKFHRRSAAGLVVAAAVLVIAGLLLVGDGQQTLCAQALKAIEEARTLHMTTKEYRDGKHVKDHEIWYDRRTGMREQERYENRTDVRIDNGQYEWRYAEGGAYLGRQKSYRDNDELVLELCATWQHFHPRRVPSGDVLIGGLPCRMYVISDPDSSCSLWADEQSRVRRVEQTYTVRPWEGRTHLAMEIEYDVQIDPQRFEPPSDSHVKTVDPRRLIEQQYPLDTALFTRETLGFTFAVHRLERCREGFKYLVCSNRLTDQTRRKTETNHPWTFYGSAALREVPAGSYYDRLELLASMNNHGIRVDWYLLLPEGDKAVETAGCDVNVEVSVANQLEETLKAEGAPLRENFRLVLPKETVRQTTASLGDLLGDLYALGEQLDPIVHSFLLTEVLQGPNVSVGRRPGIQLSKEQYVGNVQQRVRDASQRR